MTASFSNQDPAPLEIGVSTSKKITFYLDEDTTPIAQVDTRVYIETNDGEQLAYDGALGGWQAPFVGNMPVGWGTLQGQFVDVYVPGGWFEDLDVGVRAEIGAQSLGPYSFEIETLGFVRNSGGEAPGATADDAKAWTREGGSLRQKSPTSWPTPPEGEFVFTLIDDAAFPAYSQSRKFQTTSADLTGVAFVRFTERLDFPTIDAGDLIDLYVLIDSDIAYHRQLTSADAGIDETTLRKIGVSAYTGVHEIKVVGIWTKSGDQVWVEELATPLLFDGASEESEPFEAWYDGGWEWQYWVEGTSLALTFNGGGDDHETFEVWP